MKVAFATGLYDFHMDYYRPIMAELKRRGHKVTQKREPGIKFTLSAEYVYNNLGGKFVYIGHGFDMKGVIWDNRTVLREIREKYDYAFVYGERYKRIAERRLRGVKTIITGMAKLDDFVHESEDYVLHVPTYNDVLDSTPLVLDANIPYRLEIARHPLSGGRPGDTMRMLRKAKVVIADYSSVGAEAIILGIPTVFVKMPKASRPYYGDYSEKAPGFVARRAGFVSDTPLDIREKVMNYWNFPHRHKNRRETARRKLCSYLGTSAKRTVDVLERINKYGDDMR